MSWLDKKVVTEGLKRAIYKPTQKCFDLTNTMLAFSEWSEKWIPDPDGPRINVTSAKKGETLKLTLLPFDQATKYTSESLHISYGTDLKKRMKL